MKRKPVNSERVRGGYVFVKVAEPDVWKRKQVLFWEQLHGEKIDGKNEVVIFLDGNRLNFAPENLYKLTRQEYIYLNRNFPQTKDPKEKLCYIALLKYRLKVYGKAKEQGMCNAKGIIAVETHQRYLARKDNPEYKKYRADSARAYRLRIKQENPERYEEMLQRRRERRKRKRCGK